MCHAVLSVFADHARPYEHFRETTLVIKANEYETMTVEARLPHGLVKFNAQYLWDMKNKTHAQV